MNQQTSRRMLVWGGLLGGIGAMLGLGLAVWNSKQMRAVRRVRRAGRILYGVGSALHSVSNAMDETLG